MDFLILRPLSPETGYHFFEGGVSKVCAQKASSSGQNQYCQNKQRFNGNAADRRQVGGSIHGCRLVSATAAVSSLGLEPPAHIAAVECPTKCPTTQPLRVLH